MNDNVIPIKGGTNKRLTLSIEETILKAAQLAFADLEQLIKAKTNKTKESDIFNSFTHLTGITTMIEIKNQGLSRTLVSELKIIDTKALYLMRTVSGIKID